MSRETTQDERFGLRAPAGARPGVARVPLPTRETASLGGRRVQCSDPLYEYDGLRVLTVDSDALAGRGDMSFWQWHVPHERPTGVVILLHGIDGSHWGWSLRGGAHRTLARLISQRAVPPLALAMPSDGLWGDGSAYIAHHGRDYGRWITHEVRDVALELAGLTPDAPVFIGGFSMGGYGALRLAAQEPSRFRAASGHSLITRLDSLAAFAERVPRADEVEGGPVNIVDALQACPNLPPIRFDCGLRDELLMANRELHAQLEISSVPHVYEESDGGHDWTYWSRQVEQSLRWFSAQA